MTDNQELAALHQDAARWRKVARMFAALLYTYHPSIDLTKLDGEGWLHLAQASGTNPPSDETKDRFHKTFIEVCATIEGCE